MRLLITGAGGMLGQDLASTAEASGLEVMALPRAALDVTDRSAVEAAVSSFEPAVVVNCAAWTDVDRAESAFDEANAVNGDGAGDVAEAAARAGAWTIHLSTDYVFDGAKHEPYVESDPTAPLSAYARSKLRGEQEVARRAPGRHTIVRTSWLFGQGGPCFPATILRLAGERDELSVVHDQVGCPTFTGHLAPALVELAQAPVPGPLHVAGGGQCSWFQFAVEIVALAGSSTTVNPCTTSEMARPAHRPAYSVLRSERGAPELPEWREGLREYMAVRV